VPSLCARLDAITNTVRTELEKQGFEKERIHIDRLLNMRFEGTDTALMVLPSAAHGEISEDGTEDFGAAFKRAYKSEFGFLLEEKRVSVDDIKVRGTGKTYDTLGQSVFEELKSLKHTRVAPDGSKRSSTYSTYFDKIGRVEDTPVFELDKLEIGDEVAGPAIIIDDTQTIVVIPSATAVLTRQHLVLTLEEKGE
jgi:5-oxoprolinase (ATP-hydrolysing)